MYRSITIIFNRPLLVVTLLNNTISPFSRYGCHYTCAAQQWPVQLKIINVDF